MALVGDAAHTHDPLLAQGAGRAIESGVALAAAVAAWRDRGEPGGETLQAAIRAEAARQRERDLLLQTLGGVASSMGQAGPAASGARQLALAAVPQRVVRWGFDRVMALTMRQSWGEGWCLPELQCEQR